MVGRNGTVARPGHLSGMCMNEYNAVSLSVIASERIL